MHLQQVVADTMKTHLLSQIWQMHAVSTRTSEWQGLYLVNDQHCMDGSDW